MTKTIEEAAEKFVAEFYQLEEYGDEVSDVEIDNSQECFEAGANYILSLPLSSRMTEEEKERVRNMYKELSECIENRTADVEYLKGKRCQLVIIFGADFFKEGE